MATVETDDLSIRCEETGPEPGDVLLLHGWPEDASTWDGMANFFWGGGYRVIVLRCVGSGSRSSGHCMRPADPSCAGGSVPPSPA